MHQLEPFSGGGYMVSPRLEVKSRNPLIEMGGIGYQRLDPQTYVGFFCMIGLPTFCVYLDADPI